MKEKNQRLGATRVMHNGMKATIIIYRGADDIDVQFEDGYISEHKSYRRFMSGNIKNPNCLSRKHGHVGETRVMHNGIKATIIEYRTSNDIDVQFEDGTVVTHRQYNCFLRGSISNCRQWNKSKRIGETRTMNCGLKATIIDYRRSNDIDVLFETGVIVRHRQYGSFKIGSISPSK